MKKMIKYNALITVDASISIEFEAPEGTAPEELAILAMNSADNPSVCHHCSDSINIGDLLEVHEVIEESNRKSVYEIDR
jgi:hypothetical protein